MSSCISGSMILEDVASPASCSSKINQHLDTGAKADKMALQSMPHHFTLRPNPGRRNRKQVDSAPRLCESTWCALPRGRWKSASRRRPRLPPARSALPQNRTPSAAAGSGPCTIGESNGDAEGHDAPPPGSSSGCCSTHNSAAMSTGEHVDIRTAGETAAHLQKTQM